MEPSLMQMRCVVDAHLPPSLADFLRFRGWDAVHVKTLPKGDGSSDDEIRDFALAENRIIISKDHDFVQSYLIRRHPKKLLFLAVGNMTTLVLLDLFRQWLPAIEREFKWHSLLEIQRVEGLIVRG